MDSASSSILDHAAIGAIYVTTELHLLTDHSPNYTDTWRFLEQRVSEWNAWSSSNSMSGNGQIPPPWMILTKDYISSYLGLGDNLRHNNTPPLSDTNARPTTMTDAIMVASSLLSSLAGAAISLTLSSPSSVRMVHHQATNAATVAATILASSTLAWTSNMTSTTTPPTTTSTTTREADGTQPGDYERVVVNPK